MTQHHKEVSRNTFPVKLAKQVQSQFTQFGRTDMTGYTFAKTSSDFRGARSDLSIYDQEGKLVLLGRDFGDRTFFWTPVAVA